MHDIVPRNNLAVAGATAASFTDGTLEDWTAGALVLDGKTSAVLADASLKADYAIPMLPWELEDDRLKTGKFQYPGAKRKTVDMGTRRAVRLAV